MLVGASPGMSNATGTRDAKRVEQGNHVFRRIGRTERFNWLVGFAKSPDVRSYERETILQAHHQRLPCEPELRPSVQQEERVSSPSLGDMELSAIGADGQMLH